MSVWSTKSFVKDREYIVIQHTLRGVNYVINGVKFRDSYAVVEKGSKTYALLKKVPVLRAAKEYPLIHLLSLHFITRTSDIKTVFGQDVYSTFLNCYSEKIESDKAQAELKKLEEADRILAQRQAELEKKIEIEKQIKEAKESGDQDKVKTLESVKPQIEKCCFKYEDDKLCKTDALDYSPSNYCGTHLLEDPRLPEFDLEVPRYMSKDEKRKFREKCKHTLTQAKKQGKF